jgi:hypothetical protein
MKHLTKPHTLAEIGIQPPWANERIWKGVLTDRKIDGEGLLFGCAAGAGVGIGG